MGNEQRENAVGAILPVAEAEDVLAKIESDPSMKRRYDANKKSVMKAYLLWLFRRLWGISTSTRVLFNSTAYRAAHHVSTLAIPPPCRPARITPESFRADSFFHHLQTGGQQ